MNYIERHEFDSLQSDFFTLQTEVFDLKRKLDSNSDYEYDSVYYKLNELERKIMTEVSYLNEMVRRIYDSYPIQQNLNTYYLEHKDNYDKEFFSNYEFEEFIKEKLDLNFGINGNDYSISDKYSFYINYNGKYTYFECDYIEILDFLILVSCFNKENNNFKYCVNTEKLFKFIKEKIFNTIMTNDNQ